MWCDPALTERKTSALAFGPETWPNASEPQQERRPSARSAQEWYAAAPTAVYASALELGPETWPKASYPQHASRPSARTAHV